MTDHRPRHGHGHPRRAPATTQPTGRWALALAVTLMAGALVLVALTLGGA